MVPEIKSILVLAVYEDKMNISFLAHGKSNNLFNPHATNEGFVNVFVGVSNAFNCSIIFKSDSTPIVGLYCVAMKDVQRSIAKFNSGFNTSDNLLPAFLVKVVVMFCHHLL